MGYRLGLNCKLYRNTGTYASPTWVEIENVKDLTLNLEKDKADASTRGGGGWKQEVTTQRAASLEWQMVWDPADTDFTAIKDAWFQDATVDLLALDGPVTQNGSQGLRAVCTISKFTRKEGLTDVVTVDVEATPTYGQAPTWYTVSS